MNVNRLYFWKTHKFVTYYIRSVYIITYNNSCDNHVTFQMYKFQRRQSELLCAHVSSYLCQTEKLLSILTQSINTIQEREIVYHGFDR